MRALICLLIILDFIFLFGCKSDQIEYVKFRPYKARDYITKDLEIYKVNKRLYPILDSIIVKAEMCPMYEKLKDKIAFSIDLFARSPMIANTSPHPNFMISVVYAPKFANHGLWTEAVSYYKGYDFYLKGKFIDSLMVRTGRVVSMRCIDPQKYQFDWHFRGDKDMYWWYEYRNDSILNTSYGVCLDE